MPAPLDSLFRPSSIAVIGASSAPHNLGHRIVRNLVETGFGGEVYPVHPRGGEILQRSICRSIGDMPHGVSLAVVCVPRHAVLEVVDQCAEAKVKTIIVVSAGFAESDADGAKLQQSLAAKAQQHGIRIIGPNCVGVIHTDPAVRLNTTFCPLSMRTGPVALCSQSGALGVLALAKGDVFNLGFSQFVSVGNEADVSVVELLDYWGQQDEVEVIGLYLESITDAARFRETAHAISRRKPIVAIKSGRDGAGSRAARSHTAALTSSDVAVEALFHQSGVIRVDGLDEMLDLAGLLAHQSLPAGSRVGIVTNAGGPAVLCADACADVGLQVPVFTAELQQRLARVAPPPAVAANPVDMLASAGPAEFRQAIEILLGCDQVDALMVIYVPVEMVPNAEFVEAIGAGVAAARSSSAIDRPVIACVMSQASERVHFQAGDETIPCCTDPAAAARAIGKAAAYSMWREQPAGKFRQFDEMDFDQARRIIAASGSRASDGWLSSNEVAKLADALRLSMLTGTVALNRSEAADAARRCGFPVALKTASARILHKTDIGAVEMDLNSEDDVQLAFDRILARAAVQDPAAADEGVLVQPMCGGIELMIGAARDPQLGAVLAFGLGGTRVEILGDVCHRLAPITDREASEMVRSIRGYRLLTGYRGQPPVDVPAVEQLLLRVSQLIDEIPEVVELDFNPIVPLAPGEGVRIVDARIRVQIGVVNV